jgi:hypothetical protein
MSTTAGEFCPNCKLRNVPGAIICEFCGTVLNGPPQETGRTTDKLEEEAPPVDRKINPFNLSLVPSAGLGIYLENTVPITVMYSDEATLGRRAEGTGGLIVDLAPFGAIQAGVSRRHAMIRRAGEGYELVDLESTNGTWIDREKLEPNKPYPLRSGAIVRLGRLNLLVFYKKASR